MESKFTLDTFTFVFLCVLFSWEPEKIVGEAAVHVPLRVSPARVHGPRVPQHRGEREVGRAGAGAGAVPPRGPAALQLPQQVHPAQLVPMGAAAHRHPGQGLQQHTFHLRVQSNRGKQTQ